MLARGEGIRRIDGGRSPGQLEVPRRGIREPRVREDAVCLLPGRRVQRRQAVVGDPCPRIPGAIAALVYEIVICRCRGWGRVVDADISDPAVAEVRVVRLASAGVDGDRGRVDDGSGGIVHRDVVLDVVVAARTFDVDAVCAVVIDRIADDAAAGHVEVVDAVIAIIICDVVGDERIVAARVDVDPGVFVGVRHIADDGVARRDVIDAVGIAFILVGVVEGRVPLHGHAGRGAGQIDAMGGVVVGDIALDESSGEVAQVNPGCRG